MKTPQILSIIVLGLILYGCQNESFELTLISPEFESEIDFQNVKFEWFTIAEGPSRLTVSNDSVFSTIVLDTTIASNNFTYDNFLPNSTYFWKVEVGDVVSSAEFSTEHLLKYISDFDGDLTVQRYYQNMSEITGDTTYTEGFEFSMDENSMNVDSDFNTFDIELELIHFNSVKKRAVYDVGSGSNFIQVEYFYANNSLKLSRNSGGISGGTRWRAEAKK